MKRIFAVIAAMLLALAAPLVSAQNVDLGNGSNYRFGSVGVGTLPDGTAGDLSVNTSLGVGIAPSTVAGQIKVGGVGGANGMIGDTSGAAASASLVGEVLKATVVAGSSVSETTATPVNITSLSLTPGDWEITGACDRTLTGTTATIYGCSLSGTTGALSTQPGYTAGNLTCGEESLVTQSATFGTTVTGRYDTRIGPIVCRVVTAAATVFLVGGDTFSAGTVGLFGTIKARRVR